MYAATVTRSTADVDVWVIVPALSGDQYEYGPCQWIGAQPDAGDRVLVATLDGDPDEVVVLGLLAP